MKKIALQEERRNNFLQALQEKVNLHNVLKDRAEKLAEHLGISVGEAMSQLKAHIAHTARESKKSVVSESVSRIKAETVITMYLEGSIDFQEYSNLLVSSNIIAESIDMKPDMIFEMADSDDLDKYHRVLTHVATKHLSDLNNIHKPEYQEKTDSIAKAFHHLGNTQLHMKHAEAASSAGEGRAAANHMEMASAHINHFAKHAKNLGIDIHKMHSQNGDGVKNAKAGKDLNPTGVPHIRKAV